METEKKSNNDFITIASHQLRTPLTAIKWYADILLSEKSGGLNTQQREFILEVYHANERMVRLVDNLLIVEQAERGQLPIVARSTSISDLVNSVIKEYSTLAKVNRIALIAHCDDHSIPMIKVDPIYMRVAVKNLLDNALRYTLRGGSVTVVCALEDDKLTISISDTGIGISTEDQARIFTKFFRSEKSQEMQSDGSGLGLYIAKVIIEHNGGKLWFESIVQGTVFNIQFNIESKDQTL